MKAVIQRVKEASVTIEGKTIAACGPGLLVFLGVVTGDGEAEAQRLAEKILKLRIFPDGINATGLSVEDIDGDLLVISQFTLAADCRKGNRPSFKEAEEPTAAKHLYEYFLDLVSKRIASTACGEFGADMQVALVNDGPFTILLDTEDLSRPRHP